MAFKVASSSKDYSRLIYILEILGICYTVSILLLFVASGWSQRFALYARSLAVNTYAAVPLYFLGAYLVYWAFEFPLVCYRSFILEHRFSLSTQRPLSWFSDHLKSSLIFCLIALVYTQVFYLSYNFFPASWWLTFSLFWIFFGIILTKITPVAILPLFFAHTRCCDENLTGKIGELARGMGIGPLEVFEINFSKVTHKANAAFLGLGKTRRVLLADTLQERYSQEEILVILAHEFAHHKLGHMRKMIILGAILILAFSYLVFIGNSYVLAFFGFASLGDVAALPIILAWLALFNFLTQPFTNFISRRMERHADSVAIEATGLAQAFISMLGKLSTQNLSDKNPHPLVKFLFFDHPPIDERITLARAFLKTASLSV
ncbi:MAG: M48 family metallopeptidase [Candidatus Omnitrophica bacterium]|nr:M48 family metallopeptidase [Candidatus Omnitrophota bacterium]